MLIFVLWQIIHPLFHKTKAMAANTSTTSLPYRLGYDDGIETNEYGILDDSFQFSVTSAPTTIVSSMFVEQTAPPPTLQQSSLPGSVEMGYISSSHSESDTSATPNTFVCLDRSNSSSPHRDEPPPFVSAKNTQNATAENEYMSFADTLADVSVIEQEETLEYTMEEFDGVVTSAPSDEKDQKIESDDLHELLNYSGSSSKDNIDQSDEESSTYSELGRHWEARLGLSPRRKEGSDCGYHMALSKDDSFVDIVNMDRVNQHWSEKFFFDDTPQACMYVFDGMLDYLDLPGPTCIQRLPSQDKSDTSQSSHSIHSSRKTTDENTVKTEDSYFDDNFCCDIEKDQEIELLELLHPTDSDLLTNDGDAHMCGCFEMSDMNHEYTQKTYSNRRKRNKLAHAAKRFRSSDKNEAFNGLETIDENEEGEEEDGVVSNRPGRLDSEDSPLFGDLDFKIHWDEEEFKKSVLASKALDTTLETADESTSMSYSTFSC